jgi:arsenite-transporting ATPase
VVIDETRRSFAYLSLYGVATDAVLVNRVLPPEAATGYFARWAQRERAELEEIEQSFPVPQFRAPLYPSEPIGVEAMRELATEIYGDRDPAALFTRARPIRLAKRGGVTRMEIDLVHASTDELDLTAHGDQLLVRVRDAQRRITLPDSVAGRPIASAKLSDGVLEVTFGA